MFQKKTLIFGLVVVALGLAFGTFFIRSNHKRDTKQVKASSATNTITTQVEWELGTNTNTLLNSPSGSIKISDLAVGSIVSTGAGDSSYNGTYAQSGTYNGQPAYTNGSRWLWYWPGQGWMLGIAAGVGGLGTGVDDYEGHHAGYFKFTIVPTDITGLYEPNPPPFDDQKPPPVLSINSQATHTSAPTQLDGGANFWQWENFTDTKTTPVNTSVTYRYRTSANSTDWTSWVSDISTVTSRTGDDSNNPTKYRYLQIEATLSNTDGASTPTIDSYSIGYHTNQKPNAPTAMTAVIN